MPVQNGQKPVYNIIAPTKASFFEGKAAVFQKNRRVANVPKRNRDIRRIQIKISENTSINLIENNKSREDISKHK